MPLVPSHDPGNRDGKVHSHRFPAANTAVPYVNQDEAQLDATREVSEVGLHHGGHLRGLAGGERRGQRRWCGAADDGPQAMTTFRGGRRGRADRRRRVIREVGKVAAPLDASGATLAAGHHGARGRGGAHAQDRPFLPGRHGGRVRRLAGTAGEGRRRARRSSGAAAWRTTARGRWSRARTSTAPISSTAKATRSTSAMPGRRAACCTCG